jgi:hypothetical protein
MYEKKENIVVKDEYLVRLSSPPEDSRPQKLIPIKDNRDNEK